MQKDSACALFAANGDSSTSASAIPKELACLRNPLLVGIIFSIAPPLKIQCTLFTHPGGRLSNTFFLMVATELRLFQSQELGASFRWGLAQSFLCIERR